MRNYAQIRTEVYDLERPDRSLGVKTSRTLSLNKTLIFLIRENEYKQLIIHGIKSYVYTV